MGAKKNIYSSEREWIMFLKSALIYSLLFYGFGSSVTMEATNMPKYYVIKIEKKDVCGQVIVNGVPVILWPTEKSSNITNQLNAWIVPETNKLRIHLAWPEGKTYTSGKAQCKLTLEALNKGESVGSSKPLLEFKWPLEKQEEKYPFETTLEFKIDDPPPSDFWKNAKPFEFTEDSRGQILEVLTELHKAMSKRNIEGAAKLLDFKTVDVHKTYYFSADEARADVREFLGMALESKEWSLMPLDPNELQMHVLADNRIVWVTGPNYENPLRSKPDCSPPIVLPVYLAPVNGKWTIVR